jgi:predicted house-cleaning noncanonical NTP pyrophosphatase (MazG superfamily)
MYKKIKYRKLVRDKVPEKIIKDPDALQYSLTPKDMFMLPPVYADKVVEEAKEVAEALINYTNEAYSFTAVWEKEQELKSKLIEEIGDLLDVVKVLRERYDIQKEDIKAARKKKNKELGGFDKNYFLDWVVRRKTWKLK